VIIAVVAMSRERKMAYYVGVDVGLRASSLCIVDELGAVCLERTAPSEVEEIASVIRGFTERVEGLALETGNLAPWLATGLRAKGFRVVVLEARQVKTTLSSLRNKTDRNDARGIAQILRTGWYREVHVKSPESQRLKTLLAARKALLRRRIDLENEIRGLLKVYGARLPVHIYHRRFDDMARQAIMADPSLDEALDPLLEARAHLYRAFLDIDRRVKALALADPICQVLMSAPGVGYIAALTYKAAVDDPKRFRRSKTVAAHFGLTPRRYQSGERDNPGRISKAGDVDVRSALFLAANAIMNGRGKSSPLRRFGARLSRAKGRRRALVAVARKLAVVLHTMWTDGTMYCREQKEALA
jgi:transposase